VDNEVIESLGEGVAIIGKQRNDAVHGSRNAYQCGICGGILKSGYGKPFCISCQNNTVSIEDRFQQHRELPTDLETAKAYFREKNAGADSQ